MSVATERCYLDYNATAPLRASAREAMLAALGEVGNPSSVHAEGRRARALVESARERVAAFLGAHAKDCVFTSGATEAANAVLAPGLRSRDGRRPAARLLVGASEHPAIRDGHRFPADAVATIPVLADGLIDLSALRGALAARPEATIVAVQAANNETGVVQPVREIAQLVREAGGYFVCDAVQAAGRIPVEVPALGADAVIVSGHKLGGPAGIGAVAFAAGLVPGSRLISGGGQERGARAGTENIAGIAGFAAAAEEAAAELDAEATRLSRLRERAEDRIRSLAPAAVFFGAEAPRLANTSCFAVPGLKAETALIAFDLAGIALSSGAACSSGKVGRSHVLAAMGVDPALAAAALRLSLGWASTEADVIRFGEACESVFASLYGRRAAA